MARSRVTADGREGSLSDRQGLSAGEARECPVVQDDLIQKLDARVPWIGSWLGRPARPRTARLHGQPDGPRGAAGRAGTGRPSGAPGGAARVPQRGARQQPGQRVDLSGSGPERRAPRAGPGRGVVRPEPGDDDHLGAEFGGRRARLGGRPGRGVRRGRAGARPARRPPRHRGRRAHGDDARADRLDQGERGRARRRRRGGGRPDRRRDPPPAGAGADPGDLGVRRLGQPAGRAAAAEQAHRDGLHPHRPARREPARRRQGALDPGGRLRSGPQGHDPQAHRRALRGPRGHRRDPRRRDRDRVDLRAPWPRSPAAGAGTRTRRARPTGR